MNSARDIEAQAASRLARRELDGWTSEDEAELAAWLDSDLAHRVEYLRLAAAWAQTSPLKGSGARTRALRVRGWLPYAIAASIAAVAIIGGTAALDGLRSKTVAADYGTAVGGMANITMEDGSRLRLNTDTHLRTQLDGRTRQIWLYQGEFYVDVAHDAGRPFVVHVDGRTVRAFGTKFVVRRGPERLQVVMLEGSVGVESETAAQPATKIHAGDDLTWSPEGLTVQRRSATELGDEVAWRDGFLVFQHTTLADAANEFNRYNRRKLVIAGTRAAEVEIGGRFSVANVDGFVRLLHTLYGLDVKDEGDQITIS